MQRLTLIRHGESECNREDRIQGISDCDLSDLGREQAKRLKTRLDLERIDVAYSSTATRALETARVAVGSRLRIDGLPDLREINLGVWEGELASTLKERFPVETGLWFREPSKLKIEGAEPIRSFRHRVTRELNRIRRRHDDESIVVFTHGGVICTYLTSLLGLKLDDLWRFKVRNGSITRLIFPTDDVRIEALNDVSHLDGAVRYAPNVPPQYLI
ncbi:MAG: histidine phosphatase family protein [Candidatus Latescibacterota bacterium]|nr:MAG: histidine phosphatase family protein [Candidatus Latescibacterota bacterium]